MAKLKAAQRNKLPSSDFAVAGRKYPVNDEGHARNALARVAQHGSPEEKAEVKAKVHAEYPGIQQKTYKRSVGRFAAGHQAVGHHEGRVL